MNENETTFEDKASILSDLWLEYKFEPEFADFVEYNDLGLPFAYGISNGIIPATEEAKKFVNEAFDLLLAGLGIDSDSGYETLEDLLSDGAEDSPLL